MVYYEILFLSFESIFLTNVSINREFKVAIEYCLLKYHKVLKHDKKNPRSINVITEYHGFLCFTIQLFNFAKMLPNNLLSLNKKNNNNLKMCQFFNEFTPQPHSGKIVGNNANVKTM